MMSPFDKAARWHFEHGGEMEFSEVIEAHAQGGIVIATPEVFWLARRVMRDWPEARRCNPWAVAEHGDCWHVFLAAGDWRGTMEKFLPRPLPWVSYHRRGVLRVDALEKYFSRAKWRA